MIDDEADATDQDSFDEDIDPDEWDYRDGFVVRDDDDTVELSD